MKQQLQDVLRDSTNVLCKELDPDHEFRSKLHLILTHQQIDSVYVRIISIFI